MLKHLPQLMKFKTAMDVRIGLPNKHLAGSARNEINQPMYATSVGLILRGFDFLETYKKTFNAGAGEEFGRQKQVIPVPREEVTEKIVEPEKARTQVTEEKVKEESFTAPVYEEEKVSIADKIKSILSKMFEVEDQSIGN